MRENAGLQREGMQQAGSMQREGMQQAGANQRSLWQHALDQQKINLDAETQGIANRATRLTQGLREQIAAEADPVRRRSLVEHLRDVEGKDRVGGGVPSGYRARADGTGLEPIPGGPADPAAKGTLNETQANALAFGTRMQEAGRVLDDLSAQGVDMRSYPKMAADAVGLGALANWTQSPEQQQVEQAQRDFVNAVLRRESGAAISESEFESARKQYFVQPGDSPKVIEQKRQNRELATRGMLATVPNAENRVQQVVGQQRAVTRTGSLNGRKVVEFSDGSVEYADN
jgi:hypothetical protein